LASIHLHRSVKSARRFGRCGGPLACPFYGLGLADESEDSVGEDCAVAVEALTGNGDVAVLEQVCFDDCLKGGFIGLAHVSSLSMNSARSRRADIRNLGSAKRHSREPVMQALPWQISESTVM